MGPLPAGSDGDAPTAANLRNDISVYVDGIGATPLYAGRAPGYPGVDQINFKLPADVRPRCYVPIAISTAGRFTFCGRLPGDDFCSNTRFLSANQPAVATGMKRSAPKKRRGRKSMSTEELREVSTRNEEILGVKAGASSGQIATGES